ncbi:MAG TPA: FixH family protein [Ignavibacteria bacterium]|nr:FixH family protein [Ignavibacteria bacterium]HMR41974.1 FixH family protein [Ignavibacteria bacterium]
MKKIHLIFFILLTALLLQSCSDDSVTNNNVTPPVSDNLTLLGSQYSSGMKISLYSDTILFVGYNNLYIEVKDSASDAAVIDAHVEIMPMMDMTTMMHSCPYDNPSSTNAVNGKFPCDAVFIMPSTAGNWTLETNVHNHVTNAEGSVVFPLSVTEPMFSTLKSKTVNGSTYFISMIEPSKPIVGINDFMIKVNKRVTMMNFPNDSAYSFSMYPWMPSMGHSSPNNVNPVYSSEGTYNGDVNFTMTGDWRITLKFIESPQDSVSFDLLF